MAKRIVFIAILAGVVAACTEDTPSSPNPTGAPANLNVEPRTGRVTATDAMANVPTFLWADRSPKAGKATATRPTNAADAARRHVAGFAHYYRLAPDDAAALELRDLHDTGRGAIIARFGRRIDGIEVFGEQLSVAMDRNLDVVALTGYVTGDLPGVAKMAGQRARDAFTLGTARAMRKAVSDLAGVNLEAADFEAPAAAPGEYQRFRLRPGGALRADAGSDAEPTRGKQVFYRAAADALVPAYYVEADLGNDATHRPRMFSYLIAADDGRVLSKLDLTAYDNPITYRVYADSDPLFMPWDGPQGTDATPHPTGTANGFQPAFVPAQLVTLSSLTAVGVTDPWLPPGATETLGNNVDAYLDISPPDGFTVGSNDFRGTMSADRTFDYTFDQSLGANANATQRLAAVTQLFYNTNWFHDWYYAAGFTESAGNAQFSNYGRGGVEGDGLRAEAQDSSGLNNANMSTPADGGRPRMQMFLWTKPTALKITISQAVPPPDQFPREYTAINTASFGPLNFDYNAEIVRANPVDACAPLVGDYVGKIVFVDRGGPAACNGFAGKTLTVQAAGGIGLIIANVASSPNPTVAPAMGGTPTAPVTIGPVSVNFADGEKFRAALAAGTVAGEVLRAVKLLDGDIDNQIVAHEWGHYISNRLIFNSAGLQNNMSRGLGEGWADFHAMLITVREEDTQNPTNTNWQGTYGVGDYATGADPNSYYFGIRRYPYSTDMGKNPMTFKHISDVNPLPASPPPNFIFTNSEVHDTGEIWTTMLWECYASLLRDTLGAQPRLTFADARDRMRDYIVAAYKMTPANPTLLEARDALLLAALINDPTDYQRLGAAFAKRGAGVYAVAPPRGENTNTPVVESYAFGAAVQQTGATLVDDVTAACTADVILDNGETGTLRVTFRNVGNSDTPALTATVTSGAGITFPQGNTLAVPAIPRGGTADATVQVSAAGLAANTTAAFTVTTPDAGAGEALPVTYVFPVAADEVVAQSTIDTVERSTTVWSQTSSLPTPPADVLWSRVATSVTNHAYRCRTANVAATVELVSPQFAVPVGGSLSLAFTHRYSFERDSVNNFNFDGGVIEYTTDNGVTWTDVFTLPGNGAAYNGFIVSGSGNPLAGRPGFTGTSTSYPAFRASGVNLGTSFGGKQVRLRFRVASDAAISAPGWEIDDIQINGAAAPLFAGLIPQSGTCNNQPIASAGLNQTVGEFGPAPAFTPTTVFLDGSASFDPNGDALTYQWTQLSGQAVTLSNPTARIASFTAPQVPRTPAQPPLVFQLVVSDGTILSSAKLTSVTVVNVNRPPVANAGAAQSAPELTTVTLDGTGSSDPDPGDPALTYTWTAPAGITLSSATAAQPTFTAPEVKLDTPFTFTLTVSDGLATSAPATVVVTVTNVNHAPTANAGANQTVAERTTVTLDGTGSSDPDGDAFTYEWTAPPGVTLSDAAAAQPTFTAPDVGPAGATFTFSLVVRDSFGAPGGPATVDVAVTNVNRAPTANAGASQTVNEGATVTLDGTGSSDPDGEPLAYEWTAPAGITLSDATAAQPTFTAPQVGPAGATLTFSLVVRDPLDAVSAAASVDVTVTNVNAAPTADAGDDQTVSEGTTVTLDGTGSSDPDGDELTYEWTAPDGITLSDATAAQPTFTAPQVGAAGGTFTFSLVVRDTSNAASEAATVTVTVTNINKPPVANAGANQTVGERTTVTLDGTGSFDPDGDALAYQWVAPAGIKLSSATAARPTFKAPEVGPAGKAFTFSLVVRDTFGATSVASSVTVMVVNVNRAPAANAGLDVSTRSGNLVLLRGTGADPDGDRIVGFSWTAPSGITLFLPTTQTPFFIAPHVSRTTQYTISLVVTDALGLASAPDTVVVTVRPR